jgi:hypothetical protein
MRLPPDISDDDRRICEEAYARALATDPTLEKAVAELDSTLVEWMLSLTPIERLEAVTRSAALWEMGVDASARR